jgi:hypothetical protein
LSNLRTRSDTEQVVLDVLTRFASESPGVWMTRHKMLGTEVEREYRKRFPERRNRPPYRFIQSALTRLVGDGLIERKDGEYDTYYRKVG